MADFYILCIDDQQGSLDDLAHAAEELGYLALPVFGYQQALDALASHKERILLILADYKLSDHQTGLQLRRDSMELSKDIPFVIVSGFVTRDMALEGLSCKVEAFLDKPLNRDDLNQQVGGLVESRKQDLLFKEEIKQAFFEESESLLEELENFFLAFEEQPGDQETLAAILRLLHTIKGSSSVLDSNHVRDFAHRFEDFLAAFKKSDKAPGAADLDLSLRALDGLKKLILAARSGDNGCLEELDFASLATRTPSGDDPAEQAGSQGSAGPEKTKDVGRSHALTKVPTVILDRMEYHAAEITIQKNMIQKLMVLLQRQVPMSPTVALLNECFEELGSHHASAQIEMTKVRTSPFAEVVKPLNRIKRDLEKTLDKPVRMEVLGGSLLIDQRAKRILGECLVHMLRNCMDHGIEDSHERKQTTKPPQAMIRLSLRDTPQNIIVDVEDDGRGVHPGKVKAKALEKGLHSQEELDAMDNQQLTELIFKSGFSTAAQVSDVSGRGVGMDMVKTSMEEIGGRVQIASTLGQGTKITLVLPKQSTSLSVESLLVKLDGFTYAIPQARIARLIDLSALNGAKIFEHQCAATIDVDDHLYPLVDLKGVLLAEDRARETVGMEVKHPHATKIVLLSMESRSGFAVLVDEILDIEEVIIRPMPAFANSLGWFRGAALMSDGSVGLVLDVDALADHQKISLIAPQSGKQDPQQNEPFSQTLSHDYLLAESFAGLKLAFKQDQILRLENAHRFAVVETAGQCVINYYNQVVEVKPLDALLGRRYKHFSKAIHADGSRDNDKGSLLIFRQPNGHPAGFYAKRIIDMKTFAASDHMESVSPHAHTAGHLNMDDQLFDIIDPFFAAQAKRQDQDSKVTQEGSDEPAA